MTPEPDLPPSVSASEALATDATAAHASDASSHGHAHSAGNTHCLNCGTKLTGPYCSACGQHDFDFHRSFRHVFMEALENIFHFDGKFFQNLIVLLFRPGQLTAEFNAGKRASQVPPFRLYIFTAFVFFLLLLATNDRPPPELDVSRGTGAGVTIDGEPATLKQALAELHEELPAHPQATPKPAPAEKSAAQELQDAAEQYRNELTSGRNAPPAGAKPAVRAAETGFERWVESQGQRARDPQFRREMGQRFFAAIPKMLLFCLPAFALLTRILFHRSGQVYLQHLVLALHYHTFIFIFLLFRDGWVFLLDLLHLSALGGWGKFAANLWLTAYPVLMLRRLFGNSWIKTIIKTLILAFVYCVVLAMAFAATVIVLFLMI